MSAVVGSTVSKQQKNVEPTSPGSHQRRTIKLQSSAANKTGGVIAIHTKGSKSTSTDERWAPSFGGSQNVKAATNVQAVSALPAKLKVKL